MVKRCEVEDCGHAVEIGNRPSRDTGGSRVCRRCHVRFGRHLRALPSLYRLCEQLLTSPGRHEERVSGGGTYRGIPLDTAVLETLELLRVRLVAWCDLVVSERRCQSPGRSVEATATFLHRHLDWLCAHPAAADAVSEMGEATEAARRVADSRWTRRFSVGACVEPDCIGTLDAYIRYDERLLPSKVQCSLNPDHSWPAHRWRELDRRVSRQWRAGTRWLSVAEVARYWSLSVGNVYRLASVHKWRRRTIRGKVVYLEADITSTLGRA